MLGCDPATGVPWAVQSLTYRPWRDAYEWTDCLGRSYERSGLWLEQWLEIRGGSLVVVAWLLESRVRDWWIPA